MPLSIDDCRLLKKAILLLEAKDGDTETIKVLSKVQDRLMAILNFV